MQEVYNVLRCSGLHARYTNRAYEVLGNLIQLYRAGDRTLQLLFFDKERLVCVI